MLILMISNSNNMLYHLCSKSNFYDIKNIKNDEEQITKKVVNI